MPPPGLMQAAVWHGATSTNPVQAAVRAWRNLYLPGFEQPATNENIEHKPTKHKTVKTRPHKGQRRSAKAKPNQRTRTNTTPSRLNVIHKLKLLQHDAPNAAELIFVPVV